MNPLFQAISEFKPVDGIWRPLDALINEAFSTTDPKEFYNAFFNVFEAHDGDDGAGVMWSAIHGMEAIGGYETILLQRFHKFPSDISRILLRRIYNSGQLEVNGILISRLIDVVSK